MSQGLSVLHYTTLVFDCDGVVLDSNKVKTKAFYQATLSYGAAAAQAMVDYHVANGGVSRYKKFAHFLEQIAPMHSDQHGHNLESLLQDYAGHVRQGLFSCEIAPGLETLRQQTPNARWLIVSGGDQAELRDVFTQRGLADLFDGGIFGSPDTKEDILSRELANGNIRSPSLFLGDSEYDQQAAAAMGLDFVFLSGWTEVQGWEEWCHVKGISCKTSIKDLMVC
ncbi:HAD family hydrolase [Billgrantia desiderata]|uniref:HAD family hydrolase n=1 Tax=Billgrantia desiderata TaxID=52021 RepID=UPI00089E4158|nr:HAD family hydrolase [Halomonas desiderata]SEG45183.1 Phosphoglycolate phosphatase, HAD superfamily [Halomonas desiderata]